jgi:hypothetical protein
VTASRVVLDHHGRRVQCKLDLIEYSARFPLGCSK